MALEYIEPKIFNKSKILAGVTTKNKQIFPKQGLSLSQADILKESDLLLHQRTFAKLLNIPYEAMKYQMQIHSNIIFEVSKDSPVSESDGMFTSEKGLVLNIKIADCAAILIYDEANEVIMGLHSGWRGTSHNIAAKGIELLINQYKSDPAELLIYISPAAGGDVYEIGEEVARLFPRSTKPKTNGKYWFDNKQEIFLQLIDAGADESKIEIAKECTIKNHNLHSYRRDKELSGRMSAFISMK